MISRLGRQINASIERLEKKLKQKNFFLFRLGWALALFLLYLSSAFLSAWSVIFFSPAASFQQFHELNPKKGFEGSYVKHRSWSRRLQLIAVSSILVIVLITVFNGFVLTPRPVKAEVQSFECTGTSGSPLPINPTTGADVTLTGSGYCQLSTAVSLNSLTVQSGVTLTHAAESTTGLDITVATDLNIASGGAISTNAKGCQGGNGGATNGYGPNPSTGICAITTSGYGGAHASGSGAGHGGRGGRGHTDAGGTTYDSSTIPALLGSGGGGGSGPAGGYGGGKIILTVSGTLTVNGTISANGQNGPTTITNGGGEGSQYAGGGGGGGRVAVYYNDAAGFTLSNITSTKGLAGTGVGSRLDGSSGSTFILDQDDDNLRVVTGLDLRSDTDYTKANITFDNGSIINCDTFATLNFGATATLAMNGTTWTCSTIDTINISAATWVTSNTNTITFDKAGAQVDWDITNTLTLNNLTYTGAIAGTTSGNGGVLSMDNAVAVSLINTDINSNINWTNLTSFNIDADSSISSNVKGCQGGNGGATNGYGPNTSTGICAINTSGYGGAHASGSGAGHGGRGGRGHTDAGGTTYDSSTIPALLGSGGGGGSGPAGGYGGGKIIFTVSGTLTVNGTISANGQNGPTTITNGGGGGSGGSVYISTSVITGSATISANGGNGGEGSQYAGGGGGGGRVAVYYNDAAGFTLSNITSTKGLAGTGVGSRLDGNSGSTFILDQDDDNLRVVTGLDLRSDTDYTKANITFDNGSIINCDTFATLNFGATATLAMNGTTWTCSTIDTINISAATWVTSNTNTITFDKAGAQVDWDITNTLTLNNLTYTGAIAGTTSGNGGVLSMDNAVAVSLINTDINSNINWTNLTSFNIDADSSISSNVKGCQGGNGGATNGYGPNTSTGICAINTSGYGGAHASGSGAGHGGRGGRGHTDAGGTTYDSSTIPALLGSGGGGGSGPAGGYGGGKIIFTVSGTLTVNGNISANGQDGPTTSSNGGGGGSGGSVYISTSSIIGSAAISANGGNGGEGSQYAGGGGGGGRVAVYYNDAGGFTLGNITATKGLAGTGVGARLDGYDGTTYTFQYTVADTPSVTAPVNMSTDSRNPTLTGTSYSSNGAVHTTTDWKITSDPEGSTIVWSKDDDAINLETTTANATNGTFSGALAGATTLVGNTIYHVFVRYTNAAGDSAWSSGNNFITNNTQPVWGGPIIDPGQVPEDGTLFWTFDLDDYCSDADGDALTYSADNDFSLGVMTINPVTHVVTFTLNANANGSDTIRFAGTDGLSSAVLSNAPTITVNAVNDAPVFTKGSNDFAMEDDASRQVNGWATGIGTGGGSDESGQVLTFTVANDNNSLFSVQPDVNESTGNLTYTLASNAFGSATVTVGLSDNGGTANGGDDTSDSQTFTLEATSINDEPSFTAGESQTMYEDTGLYTVATWVVAMSTGPSNESAQTVSFNVTNDDNSLFSVQPAIDSSGALTFTPADNINGSTTVHVTMQDNGGTTNGGDDTSAEQAFTIEIRPTNDAPSFTKGADQSAAEDAGAQTVAGWATGMSKGPADESGQTLTFNVSSDNNSLISVQPDIDESTGNLTYTPAANINGSATVTVYLSDDGGVP